MEPLNLGKFSLKIPNKESELRVGAFWKRRHCNDEAQAGSSPAPKKRPATDIAILQESQIIQRINTENSTGTRSTNVDSQASNSTTDQIPDTQSTEVGTDKLGLISRSEDTNQSSTVSSSIDYSSKLRDVSTNITINDELTHESVIVDVNPSTFETSEEDLTNDRSTVGALGGFMFATPTIPRHRQKKIYPKQRSHDRILSEVTFVLSGYVNPGRAKLRDLALSMGAKYQPKWGRGCTHLICAFKSTPKFKEVMAQRGRIVREHWVHECSRKRQLLDWRNFKLGDYPYPDSEEEVDVSDLDYALEIGYGVK